VYDIPRTVGLPGARVLHLDPTADEISAHFQAFNAEVGDRRIQAHRNLKPDFNALRINMGTSPAANSFATNENCVRTTPRSWLKVLNP